MGNGHLKAKKITIMLIKLKSFRHRFLNRDAIGNIGRIAWDFVTFGILLFIFLLNRILTRFGKENFFEKYYSSFVNLLDTAKDRNSIRRVELIDLAFRNMQMKKTRSFVTIGGMAIGIGAIVFLVSIGYGLQDLVISRVARLEEMKQVDVSPQSGSKIKINDKSLSAFSNLKQVVKALPLIGVVARINYNLSVSDMPAYGVTADYLKNSATRVVRGKLFASNHLNYQKTKEENVKGITTDVGKKSYLDKKDDVSYIIYPGKWIPVYKNPKKSSMIIGFTRHLPGKQIGSEYYGENYENAKEQTKDEKGNTLALWIMARFLLWQKQPCSDFLVVDCSDGYIVRRDDKGDQILSTGYIREELISVEPAKNIGDRDINIPQVLGTSSATLEKTASDSGVLDLDINQLLASEAGVVEKQKTKQVTLGKGAYKEAVVNRAMLKILNIKESEAVGKSFDASFVVIGELVDGGEKIESKSEKYTIVGIIPDERSPFFYVPLMDLRSLGVNNFSQVKVVLKDTEVVSDTRKKIEAMGFETVSVVDTVTQINNLFASLRLLLALLGTVALSVAALGMFNTLTVSLLERTHEVGLMKAMGMKSHEVQELFLTESMIMGFAGGICGLILGFTAGKVLGLVLSVFAVFKGVGYLDVASLPIIFVVLILGLSLVVGFATGIYPAARAKRISALDALRYE